MKKSVILLILAVYLVSVGIVGFFGIKVRIYNATVNVESVTITEVEYNSGKIEIKEHTDENGKVSKQVVEFEVKNAVFKIYYQINPSNATNKSVVAIYEQKAGIEITEVQGEPAFLVKIDLDKYGSEICDLDLKISSVSSNNTIYDVISIGLIRI